MTLQKATQTKGLSNTLRHLSLPIITMLFAMLLTVVAWGQTLDQGTYTISNTVSHDNPVGEGMARSYTEETSDVEVNESGTFVTLGFNNTQYMGDFTISVGGSKVTYETTALANNVKKLKFKVPSLSSNIKVGLYVTPMATTVEYTVTLNESSLKLIKKAETVVETVQEPVKEPAVEQTKPTTNSNTTNGSTSSQSSDTNKKNESTAQKSEAVTQKQEVASESTPSTTDTKVEESTKVKESASAKEDASVEEELELVEEPAKDVVEEVAQTEENTEELAEIEGQEEQLEETQEEVETVDAITSASNNVMKNIMLIIGIVVVIGAIGFGIYLKRK